jgi:hypothetical protein
MFLAHDDLAEDQVSEGLSLLALGYFNIKVIDYAKNSRRCVSKGLKGLAVKARQLRSERLLSWNLQVWHSLVCNKVVTFFQNEWEDCSDSEDGMGPLPGYSEG